MKKLLLLLAGCLFAGSTALAQDETETETPTATPEAIHAGIDDVYVVGDKYNCYVGWPNKNTESTTIDIYLNAYDGGINRFVKYNSSLATTYYLASSTGDGYFTYTGTITNSSLNKATITYTTENTGEVVFSKAGNITLNIEGGRTFITPLELIVPEGIKVYEYDSYSDGNVTFKQSLSGSIPAYTPVYITGSGEFTFNFVGGEDANENLFQGKTKTEGANRVYLLDESASDTYYGVLCPHLLPANSYVFNGTVFALQTDVTNVVIDPFYCYINLPVADSSLETISIELIDNVVEAGYYLGGELTANDDPNRSYMFTETEEGTYTLDVASIPSGTTFYVIYVDEDGELSYYSATSNADKDLEPGKDLDLEEGKENTIGLGSAEGTPASYLNVTFTLTLDETTPSTLSYTGTLESGFALTVGNDKTTQSGTITDQTIVMQTEKVAATIFIYVPEGSTNVLYALDDVTEIKDTSEGEATGLATFADVPENLDWKDATESTFEDGAYEAALPTGYTGTLYVKYTNNDEEETSQPYSFTVIRSVPTAVESINAGQEDSSIYNVFGQKVDESYKGIVIKNGKKYIQR